MTLTPAQEKILNMVKILLGDIEGNPYYPMMTDEQYVEILEFFNWEWKKAISSLGLSILGMSSGWNTRETVGLETIENNFNKNYAAYLGKLLDNLTSVAQINITPYASGISWKDWCANYLNPDNIVPELAKIKSCGCKRKCSCGRGITFAGLFL